MIEVIFLAIALSMDAFAVSIGLGAKKSKKTLNLAIQAGLYFGIFQALMPVIGHFSGQGLLEYIQPIDHWVAFILLSLIGGKMIYESFTEEISEDFKFITAKVMLILAIATSIDALAVGFTLSLFNVPIIISILFIGIITFIFSFIGVYMGAKSGSYLENKAELLGGVVLIGIGIKVLVEHLF